MIPLNMQALFLRCLFISMLLSGTALPTHAWDGPFNNTANWGGTGLMEVPNARILEDGVIRAGFAQALPYRWYTGAMGVFPGLEVSARYTELTNIDAGLGSDFGSYKDKALDIKYQVFPESKMLPALAMGLQDIQGTQLFEAKYVVLSRQIFPFDFTFGLGSGRLSGSAPLPFYDKVGVFGGVEWAVNRYCSLMVEYNPIAYEKDPTIGGVRPVDEKASLPINMGARLRLLPGLDLGISFQRGDVVGFTVSYAAALGRPIVPKPPDPPKQVPVDRRPFYLRDQKEMVEQTLRAVQEIGFKDAVVYTDGSDLVAEFENTKYLSNTKAVGRVLRVLLFHAPSDTNRIAAIVKKRRMKLLRVSVRPEHFERYLLGEIPESLLYRLLEVEPASPEAYPEPAGLVLAGEDRRTGYHLGLKPDLQLYLNDPSGVIKFRTGVMPYAALTPWEGGEAYARYDIPFYSDIDSSVPPSPDAVRSDSWLYLGRDYSFDKLAFDQAALLGEKTFARFSVGYFEFMYAGVNGEVLKFFGDGRLALGLSGDWVRKREPGSQLSLEDSDTYTALGNVYYRIPQVGLTLHAQIGRFMAGDRGVLLHASREYDTGVKVGGWYSFTDTDDLTGFNRGYHEKGVFLTIPARIFLPGESKERYTYAISPWTRDVAATVYHSRTLYDLGADLMPFVFKGAMKDLKK